MAHTPEIIVGIDLGTTNSLVAVCDEAGPRVLTHTPDGSEDSGLVPSFCAIDPETQKVTVGSEARAHAVEQPQTTVFSVKRLMGRGFADVQEDLKYLPYNVVRRESEEGDRDMAVIAIGDRTYTPSQISAAILSALKARAEAELGTPVRKAVITVPAYFDDAQRQATRNAGRLAGLEVERIVNEPTAAALAYSLDRQEQGLIAVYDLGGGTFDISILRLEGGIFEVLSTHGDTHLGGDDFDRCLIKLVRSEVREQFGLDIDSPAIRQQLRLLAEQIKIRLSDQEEARIEIDLGQDQPYRRLVTREEFERMIDPFVERAMDSVRHALHDGHVAPGDVDQVVLVGGSTRVPLVRRRMADFFGRRPYTALDPDRVVALGAAVQASILAGVKRDLLLLDVTPLSLGIETMGGAMGKLIMRNTRIPCRVQENFTSFVDGQTNIKINVLQGERELARDCRSLGQFELTGIPPMPAGLPKIEVEFIIDQNGILSVTATEQRSGKQASVQIIPSHGLTGEEVERMREESVRHAREDMTAHRLIDLQNQVEFDTTKTEQMLDKVGDALDTAETDRIRAAMQDLRRLAQESADVEAIYQALDAFDKQTIHLAEVAISQTLRQET